MKKCDTVVWLVIRVAILKFALNVCLYSSMDHLEGAHLICTNSLSNAATASAISKMGTAEGDVLKALSQIIDPDFGTDIVTCGFVKDLHIDEAQQEVF